MSRRSRASPAWCRFQAEVTFFDELRASALICLWDGPRHVLNAEFNAAFARLNPNRWRGGTL